jgi:hypothetical protein
MAMMLKHLSRHCLLTVMVGIQSKTRRRKNLMLKNLKPSKDVTSQQQLLQVSLVLKAFRAHPTTVLVEAFPAPPVPQMPLPAKRRHLVPMLLVVLLAMPKQSPRTPPMHAPPREHLVKQLNRRRPLHPLQS